MSLFGDFKELPLSGIEGANAEALDQLIQRLNNLHFVDSTRRFDLEYLSCAEYQLFLDHLTVSGSFRGSCQPYHNRYRQPFHWSSYTYPKTQAATPVTGIAAQDAQAFCDWLTSIVDHNVIIRLPTTKEAQENPSDRNDIATWCADNSQFNLVGLNSENIEKLQQAVSSSVETRLPKTVASFLSKDRYTFFSSKFARYYDKEYKGFDFWLKKLELALQLTLGWTWQPPITRYLRAATNRTIALTGEIAQAFSYSTLRDFEVNTSALNESFWQGKAGGIDLEEVVVRINKKDYTNALEEIKKFRATSSGADKNWLYLVEDIIYIAKAQGLVKTREAYRRYLYHLAEFAYIGYSMLWQLEKEGITPVMLSVESFRSDRLIEAILSSPQNYAYDPFNPYIKEQKFLLELFWQIQLLQLREERRLPAWEGVRIVAETKL